ncbi:polysaccharide pyruvyl transferase family protein [Rubripirellula amarantea]|uniref:Polysaccharide pyruvyl transferase n=1 Tax=Rubripirellula amarantea TaxID=2527999 RepID=A0A5C5WW37_9BACT|nr:polysaccharide pyruvyl transferase family protein [Rubripirellula amarantea]MDA8746433.1 polysaccharide pyruvyl transferase family protein [Rubripirellula amarantea]TWT54906.1 Polysaccharide pyruvyl transferase [Rubripirellula amarantea]
MRSEISNRREFLAVMGVLAASSQAAFADQAKPKHILLRSSWQTVNIGDIAHTPGVLRILETHLPEVKVTLWPSKLDNGVEELLRSNFPKLEIAQNASELKAAFEDCDFLLHGSGASLVAQRDVKRWSEETNKPYGVYGITLPLKKSSATQATSESAMAETIRLLSGARFVYFRDSHSLTLAKAKGCSAPIMEFGPDGAFACDLRDDDRADAFLSKHGLETSKFLCCIPRLRYTPYWTIKDLPFDPIKHARNEAMKEHDHAQLLAAIVEVVQKTDMKVLLCPEDQTQMKVGKEMLLDRLPDDVRKRVVWRPDYWLTGEAVSTYVRSAGLFGNEMHSPIMCVGHGVPAIVCRWAEQTSKGYMWEDIGLGDWLFNLDEPDDVAGIVPAVLKMASDPEAAKQKADKARQRVEKRQAETMAVLRNELNA